MGEETYQRIYHPPRHVEYWEKPGMMPEKRMQDWVACGGDQNGNFYSRQKEQLPGETDYQSYTRQYEAFKRCLISRGYHYAGKNANLKTEAPGNVP